LFRFYLSGEKIEHTGALEDLLYPGIGVRNPQPAVRDSRQVERPDQLAHSGGVDPRDFPEVEHDHPFTLPKQPANFVAQRSIDRHTKRTFNGNDAGTVATQLKNYAQFAPSRLAPPSPVERCLQGKTTGEEET
jgi:hypothetical protein